MMMEREDSGHPDEDELIVFEDVEKPKEDESDFDIILEDIEPAIKQAKKKKKPKTISIGIGSLKGKKPPEERACKHSTKVKYDQRILEINCDKCDHGTQSISHQQCRKNILQLLGKDPTISRIILSGLTSHEYEGTSLSHLRNLASIASEADMYRQSTLTKTAEKSERCDECAAAREQEFKDTIDALVSDPLNAFQRLEQLIKDKRSQSCDPKCVECHDHYVNLLDEILSLREKLPPDMSRDARTPYDNIIPFVRPSFSSSRIYLEPPKNTMFIRSYEVRRESGRPIQVSIYRFTDRPERMYFMLPMEYNLQPEQMEILQAAKKKLAKYRPKDIDFTDPHKARNLFARMGAQIITETARSMDIELSHRDVVLLSDIFAKYTAGLGILEDALSDEHVQDVYVNAPVSINPLRMIVDDKEHTSNIYLSEDDVNSMITRFRAISGRRFDEASPIMGLNLPEYSARVNVLGNPLALDGLAFAFRKHRREPWTLAKLISKNMLSPLAAGLLSFMIAGQSSILIAGGVGAGKSSLLSSMMLEIPPQQRIITIEDVPELPVEHFQQLGMNIQPLMTRSPVASSDSEIGPETALRATLRMGNSSLILGEVRGPEVKTLYEAMQVGTAGNCVMGTIHGASTEAVYKRIVENLGVSPQSFQVTDAVVVCSRVSLGGSTTKKRRVTQISEVMKTGGDEVDPRTLFADVMLLDRINDSLEATDLLDMGQSTLVGNIARKWGLTIDQVLQNIRVRMDIKRTIAESGSEKPSLLEAPAVSKANNMYYVLTDQNQAEHGTANHDEIYGKWLEWYQGFASEQS